MPQEVSQIVGCSAGFVARILNGERNNNTPLGQEILRIHRLLEIHAEKARKEEEKYHQELKKAMPQIKKMR